MILKMQPVNTEPAEVLSLLQRAYHFIPMAGGRVIPCFAAAALAVLAASLGGRRARGNPERRALARAVRGLADTHVVEVRGNGRDWRTVACAPWWKVDVKGTRPGPYRVRLRLYPDTQESARVVAACEAAAICYQHAYPGAPAPHPDIPSPDRVRSARDPDALGDVFTRLRFEMAAGLLGFTPWHVVSREMLLSWDDLTAARCLAEYRPPVEVVRELSASDPEKYARVKYAAGLLAKC